MIDEVIGTRRTALLHFKPTSADFTKLVHISALLLLKGLG